MLTRRSLLQTVPVALAAPAIAARPDRGLDQRIENGLRGPIVVAGEPPRTMALADRMRHYGVPAVSIAVVDAGRPQWIRTYGSAFEGEAATPKTRFQAGSISKAVAAVLAMKVVEGGMLSLDEIVDTALRSWRLPDSTLDDGSPVTLRRLLSHTAGISVHGFPGYEDGQQVPTALQILNGTPPANTPPIAIEKRPGQEWIYSGGGYQVAQRLLEDASRSTFAELADRLLFRPLGMSDSRFQLLDPDAKTSWSVARAHDREGRMVAGGWRHYPEMAAAGLWSTPSDLARLLRALLASANADGFLRHRTATQMLVPVLGRWGLGLELEGENRGFRFRHLGDTNGYKAVMLGFPRTQQGAVVMTNGERGSRLTDEILFSLASAFSWPQFGPKTKTAVQVTTAQLRNVEGRYRLTDVANVDLVVKLQQGGLVLTIEQPSGSADSQLLAMSPDRFFRRDIDLELHFHTGSPPPGLTLHQDGQVFKATRITSR